MRPLAYENIKSRHNLLAHTIDKPLHYRLAPKSHESRQIEFELHFQGKDNHFVFSPNTDEREYTIKMWQQIVIETVKHMSKPKLLIIRRKTGVGWKESFQQGQNKEESDTFEFHEAESMIRNLFKQKIKSLLDALAQSEGNDLGKVHTNEIGFVDLCVTLLLIEGNNNATKYLLETVFPKIRKKRSGISVTETQGKTRENTKNLLS